MRHGALPPVALLCLGLVVLALTGGVSADATASEETNVSLAVTDDASFDSADDIETALEDGTLESAEYVIVGETLVISVESERLASDIADHSGTPTDGFFAALEDGSLFRLVQTNPTPNRQRLVLPFGPENTTVFRNESTVYLSVDTEAVSPRYRQSEGSTELRAGQQYMVQFAYNRSEDCADFGGACEPVGQVIEFQDVEAELFGPYNIDSPTVLAPEETELSVKVNIEPEEELLVRMHLADSTTITKEPEPVSWSDFPGLKVDLSDVDPGTNYTLELVHDGAVVSRQNGSVETLDASFRNANLTVRDEGTVRLNLTATLSHGGQLQVFNSTGSRVGFTWVSPGTTNVSIALSQSVDGFAPDELTIRAVRRHGMKIDPYPGDGRQLSMNLSASDWARSTQEETATSASATPTPSPASQSPEPTTPTETPAGASGSGDGADGQGSGFTVGIVLVSILVVLAGSARRAVRRGPARDSADT